MKFIVSGDQHINIPKSLPQDWCVNRFRLLWDTYIQLCETHGAGLILAGDCYHNVKPSLQEVELFVELLLKLKDKGIETYVISGNHENIGSEVSCLDHFKDLMEEMGINYISKGTERGVDFLGHTHLNDPLHNSGILITHVRPTVNQFITEEVDIKKLISPYKLVLAGDIHAPLELHEGKLVYTNHPLNSSFEAKPDCGVLLLDTETLEWSRIPTKLPNLIQIKCSVEEYPKHAELVAQDSFNFYRVEVTGEPKDLRTIKSESDNVKLLKVPEVIDTFKESEDAVEIRDLTLEESLIEYMQELKMEEDTITKMMAIWRQL